MKLEKWTLISEIAGGVAIVISLIYVGVEVNRNARAVRSATATDTTALIQRRYFDVGTDQEASALVLRGQNDPESLSPNERLRFTYLIHSFALVLQNAWYLEQEGTLDAGIESSVSNTISGVRELPGFLDYWNRRRSVFQPEFREYVDALVETGTTDALNEELYRSGVRIDSTDE